MLHQASTDDVEMHNTASSGSLPVNIPHRYSSNHTMPLQIHALSNSPKNRYVKTRISEETAPSGHMKTESLYRNSKVSKKYYSFDKKWIVYFYVYYI